jgi:DNA-binding XRE family transcriptional regulator
MGDQPVEPEPRPFTLPEVAGVMDGASQTVPGRLVGHLRAAIKRELDTRLLVLSDLLGQQPVDRARYRQAMNDLDAARRVLDTVGVTEQTSQLDVVLDLWDSPSLVLLALETQSRLEMSRLQDAAESGIALPDRDVPALVEFVVELRRKIDALATRKTDMGQPAGGRFVAAARRMTLMRMFAKLVRCMREDAGLSQAELSRRSGLSPSLVSRIELGQYEPGLFQIEVLAHAFRLTPDKVIARLAIDD